MDVGGIPRLLQKKREFMLVFERVCIYLMKTVEGTLTDLKFKHNKG